MAAAQMLPEGMTGGEDPGGPVTLQLMDLQERASRFRFPIRDRAGQFTEAFDAVLSTAKKIPPRPESVCRTLGGGRRWIVRQNRAAGRSEAFPGIRPVRDLRPYRAWPVSETMNEPAR